MEPRFLYAFVVLLSACLLFQVQPIVGKAILPSYGGSAAVWITCLLFFQTAVLAGYVYSDRQARTARPRLQAMVHLGLLGGSLLFVPLALKERVPAGGGDPVLRILLLLAGDVGLPLLALSATSPLLQSWYARSFQSPAPYRLYALANLGSLAGLLLYPIILEPLLSLRTQLTMWSWLYVIFAVACGAATWHATRTAQAGPKERDHGADGTTAPAVESQVRWLWLFLPGCSAALLLSVTNHLCQDVASVPLLWIPPLTLYLLSFVLCFAWEQWYRPTIMRMLLLLVLAGMAVLFIRGDSHLLVVVPLYLLGLFLACLFCHGELVRLKPHPRELTLYYLLIALGGALGAVFVSLLAPRVFPTLGEFPLSLAGCALLARALIVGQTKPRQMLITGALMALFTVLAATLPHWQASRENAFLMRNFYGTLRVTDTEEDGEPIRELYSGRILHGSQFLKPTMRRLATSYYGEQSGIGRLLSHRWRAQMRVGLVGLGAGTLAVYARPGDHYRFYEINPLVVRLARQSFTFLEDCAGTVDVITGDARLQIEQEGDHSFDVLAIDAFSGDSIPVHLLTREAFALYFRKLRPDGVLAVHISNKHLKLDPLILALGREFSREVRLVDSSSNDPLGIAAANWAVIAPEASFFEDRSWAGRVTTPMAKPGLRIWTDDYSSILPLLE